MIDVLNLVWTVTGDPTFDFFFSITANFSLLFFSMSVIFSLFRGHV